MDKLNAKVFTSIKMEFWDYCLEGMYGLLPKKCLVGDLIDKIFIFLG